MHTHRVGTVDLDHQQLSRELERTESWTWSDAYSDYVFGGLWENLVLYAPGGSSGDGVVTNYDYERPPGFTEIADQLPYLRELISTSADLTRLNFVRLAKVSNSVIIPHRDLLELSGLPAQSRNAHRMHIPLRTHERSLFSEGNVVYQMAAGEVWFLNASQIHSVAVLSTQARIHLMLDFVGTADDRPFTTVSRTATADTGIPAERTVHRPPLLAVEREQLYQLAPLLRMETYDEVFSMVIKGFFRSDCGENFVWDTMTELSQASPDPDVLPHTLGLLKHYTLERSPLDTRP